MKLCPPEIGNYNPLKTTSASLRKSLIQSWKLLSFSLFLVMATLGNKLILAAASRDTQESVRNRQSQNTSVPGMTEEYFTQTSEERDVKVTKNCPKNLVGWSHVFWGFFKTRRICSDIASTDLFFERCFSRNGDLCSSGQQFSWLGLGRNLPWKFSHCTLAFLLFRLRPKKVLRLEVWSIFELKFGHQTLNFATLWCRFVKF